MDAILSFFKPKNASVSSNTNIPKTLNNSKNVNMTQMGGRRKAHRKGSRKAHRKSKKATRRVRHTRRR
jgi:hypothetical protein